MCVSVKRLEMFFLREDHSLSLAPPTGRDTNRHQTDDVVRSVD